MNNNQNNTGEKKMETTRIKPMKRGCLINKLNKAFPKGWFQKGEDYGWDKGCILTGEVSMVEVEGGELPMFEYYDAIYYDPKENFWESGMWKKFVEIVKDAGWIAEWHDAGTVHIYEN